MKNANLVSAFVLISFYTAAFIYYILYIQQHYS